MKESILASTQRAMYQHCKAVYEAMEARSEGLPDGRVYEGFLTKLFDELGLSVPYYSQVLTELKRMGCIEQAKRGGGTAMSIWYLIQPPTEDAFKSLPELTRNALGGFKVQAQFDQRIKNLEHRIDRLEQEA